MLTGHHSIRLEFTIDCDGGKDLPDLGALHITGWICDPETGKRSPEFTMPCRYLTRAEADAPLSERSNLPSRPLTGAETLAGAGILPAAEAGRSWELTEGGPAAPRPGRHIFARTFGYFDLFVDGEAVIFGNSKEKELLALLIDRNGGTVTAGEAMELLWEDRIPDDYLKRKYRKLAFNLKRTLEKYGIADILVNNHGIRNILPSRISCDYYDLLRGSADAARSFRKSYMAGYSWAETTLASLWDS